MPDMIERYRRVDPEVIEDAMSVDFVDYADNIADRVDAIVAQEHRQQLFAELADHHAEKLLRTNITSADAAHLDSIHVEFTRRSASLSAAHPRRLFGAAERRPT